MLHWSIAVPFMVCYATGMVLMLFYNLHSAGISRQVLSWLHRIAGAPLILLPVLTIVRHWREYRIHLYNINHAWDWTTGDLKWLVLMMPATLNRNIVLPDQGKFNAAEKLNFLMVLCTYPRFIATGLLIWMPERVVLFWIVHVGMALIANPLMLGHIYMALINRVPGWGSAECSQATSTVIGPCTTVASGIGRPSSRTPRMWLKAIKGSINVRRRPSWFCAS